MTDEGLDWVVVKPCGCMAVWIAATAPPKEIAREVGAAIRKGLEVRRLTTEATKQLQWACTHQAPKAKRTRKAEGGAR